MDLLESILGSMDKPPSLSEKDKERAKELQVKREKEEEAMTAWRNNFKKEVEKKVGVFLEDSKVKRLKFPPTEKLGRLIIHEVAEAAGMISQSFGVDEVDRHNVLFKKEYPPSEEELRALRNGEVFDPKRVRVETQDTDTLSDNGRLQPQAPSEGGKYGMPSNYQERYRKMLGGLDCAEKSAIKLQPNKTFGYVPSANKRDLRSIEQTLNDMKSRKRPKLDSDISSDKEDPPSE